MNKRLYRSQENKIVGGVCGGIGNYLDIDPVIIRLIFLGIIVITFNFFWVYVVLWVLIPSEDQNSSIDFSERIHGMGDDIRTAVHSPKANYTVYIGGTLILIGGALLAKNYIPVAFDYIDNMIFPLLLIGLGAFVFVRAIRER
jgi:phage shock protein PspC (stress-responsive transcriptional regulator)